MVMTGFLEKSDVACFNYYGVTSDIFATPPATVSDDIQAMMTAAGTKKLILQEVGYAGGYESQTSLMGTSLTSLQQFFENVFSEMETEAGFCAAIVF